MEFDWHPKKEALVRNARGFGFADAAGIFLDRVAEWQDTRKDYGEIRMVAVGVSDGTFYTVVYSDRTNPAGTPVRWIITAWPSHRKERALWQRSV